MRAVQRYSSVVNGRRGTEKSPRRHAAGTAMTAAADPNASTQSGTAFGHRLDARTVPSGEAFVTRETNSRGVGKILTRDRRHLSRAIVTENSSARLNERETVDIGAFSLKLATTRNYKQVT